MIICIGCWIIRMDVSSSAHDAQGNSQMMTAMSKARKASSAILSRLTLPGSTSALPVTTSSPQTHCQQVAPPAAVALQVSKLPAASTAQLCCPDLCFLCSHSSNVLAQGCHNMCSLSVTVLISCSIIGWAVLDGFWLGTKSITMRELVCQSDSQQLPQQASRPQRACRP